MLVWAVRSSDLTHWATRAPLIKSIFCSLYIQDLC
jgi:hypothetical protein